MLTDIIQRQQIADEYAKQSLESNQRKMKTRYDKRTTPDRISLGDIVYVYQPRIQIQNTKKKLQRNFHGPFLVVKFTTDNTAMLKRLSDGKFLQKSIHVRRLKKGHIRSKVNNWDPIDTKTDATSDSDSDLSEDDLPESSFQQADDSHDYS